MIGAALVTAWLHGLSDGGGARPGSDRIGAVAGVSATACTPEDVGPAVGVVLATSTDEGSVLRIDPTSGIPSSGGEPVDVRVEVGAQKPVVTVGREVALRIGCSGGALVAVSLEQR